MALGPSPAGTLIRKGEESGAATLGITTRGITPLSIMTLSMTYLRITKTMTVSYFTFKLLSVMNLNTTTNIMPSVAIKPLY
jgi:hypothetical protein